MSHMLHAQLTHLPERLKLSQALLVRFSAEPLLTHQGVQLLEEIGCELRAAPGDLKLQHERQHVVLQQHGS